MTVAPSLAPSTDFRLAIFLAAERVAPPRVVAVVHGIGYGARCYFRVRRP